MMRTAEHGIGMASTPNWERIGTMNSGDRRFPHRFRATSDWPEPKSAVALNLWGNLLHRVRTPEVFALAAVLALPAGALALGVRIPNQEIGRAHV